MAKSLSSLDPFNSFVQDTAYFQPGKFASAEFTALAFGPPTLAHVAAGAGGTPVFPAGVVQNFVLSQNKAVARIFEIGSTRAYLVPGKSVGALQFARVYLHGPSLLRMIMAYYGQAGSASIQFPPLTSSATLGPQHNVKIPPGYENLFINLASDLFSQPHGSLVLMKDTDAQVLGMFYLENCFIAGHSLATDSTGTMYQEGASVNFERVVPVKLSSAIKLKTETTQADMSANFSSLNQLVAGTMT